MRHMRTVHMLSKIGMQICAPPKRIQIIEIREYECVKAFGEIEEGLIVWGGNHPTKSGMMFIDEAGFGDSLPIGYELFFEHFEEWTHMPAGLIAIPEVMRYETQRLKNKRHFK